MEAAVAMVTRYMYV